MKSKGKEWKESLIAPNGPLLHLPYPTATSESLGWRVLESPQLPGGDTLAADSLGSEAQGRGAVWEQGLPPRNRTVSVLPTTGAALPLGTSLTSACCQFSWGTLSVPVSLF